MRETADVAGVPSAALTGVGEALRIEPRLLRRSAVALTLLGLVLVVAGPFNHWQDWGVIWSAGATAGTQNLVDAPGHVNWQLTHGILPAFFSYPPATALLVWPLARLPVDVSYWVQAALMFGCVVAAGWLAAGIYRLTRELAILAALAWAPCTASVAIGQNAPFALLLAMLTIWALRADRPWLAGAATGLLLYKPTFALPLMFLFLIRGRWRELAVTIVAGGAMFLLSVFAAGGDWHWLSTWLDGARWWLPYDAGVNADMAINLPGLVERLPLPWFVPALAGVSIVLVALPGLRRAGILEAASAACLLGLVAGPRAWGYEAALAFPFICWVLAGGIKEPWRTRLIVAAYVVCPSWMIAHYVGLSGVAPVVLAAAALWIWRWRPWRLPREGGIPGAHRAGPGAGLTEASGGLQP